MEINIGNNLNGNIGVWPKATGVRVEAEKYEKAEMSRGPRAMSSFTIEKGRDAIAAAEPLTDIPENALSRDDDLGRLISSAYCLQPPPMPNFGN